jgi:hypothetical protein
MRRVLLERPVDDRDDGRIDARADLRERRRRLEHDLSDDAERRIPLDRLLIRQQLIADCADRVDVAAVIHLPHEEFGGHVIRCADALGESRDARLQASRDAEVDDFQQPAFGVHHDVVRLEVAMDHPGPMGAGHAGADLVHHLQLARERQRLAPADDRAEGLAHDVFHREERLAVELAVFEDRDDVGMAQAAHGLGFVSKAFPQRRIVEISPDHLDGHGPVEHRIVRLVKRPHPALCESPGHLVLADDQRV